MDMIPTHFVKRAPRRNMRKCWMNIHVKILWYGTRSGVIFSFHLLWLLRFSCWLHNMAIGNVSWNTPLWSMPTIIFRICALAYILSHFIICYAHSVTHFIMVLLFIFLNITQMIAPWTCKSTVHVNTWIS